MLGINNLNTVKSQASIRRTNPNAQGDPNTLRTGKIVDIHPESGSMDVRLLSGDTLRNVRVLSNSASTVAGYRYLCTVTNIVPQQTAQGIQDNPTLSHIQDVMAIVAFLDGNWRTPRIIGFDFPADSQMHLDEAGLSVNRHESGIYEIVTADGHHETHYPDGSYVIYGLDNTPKDMASIQGKGQAWSVPTTADNIQVTVHLAQGVDLNIANGKLSLSLGEINLNESGIKILAKGQGITLTSPDGTVTKTLTIADTTGDPVWS